MFLNNYYKTLRVGRDADLEIITAAYNILVNRYSLDNKSDFSDKGQSPEVLHRAYEILSDPMKKVKYDTSLKRKEDACLFIGSVLISFIITFSSTYYSYDAFRERCMKHIESLPFYDNPPTTHKKKTDAECK